MWKSHRINLSMAITLLVFATLACSLVSAGVQPAPESIPTATEQSATEAEPATGSEAAPPATEEESPAANPPSGADIQPAASVAIPNCAAFDISAFDTLVNGSFSFVIQDQLNNCHYTSANGYNLMIGGGKPASLDEVRGQFDNTFGGVPGSSWEAIDNYYLGMAFSSVTVTAQGISSSGHTMVIVVAGETDVDPTALQVIFANVAREAARQLNQQF